MTYLATQIRLALSIKLLEDTLQTRAYSFKLSQKKGEAGG